MTSLLHYVSEPEAFDEFFERFSDGLPVVPPTERRVAELLRHVQRNPLTKLGAIMPRGAVATVHDVAVNAVMAGCPPSAFPIVVAAVESALDPDFNLNGVQSTTHAATPLIIVSGPLADRAGMNAAHNVFGGGNRTNLSIGRALRLLMINIGGGCPGETDMSVQGTPAKLSFCIAERADITAWPSLAQRQGAPAGATTVTLMAGEGPHVVSDHRSRTPEALLTNVAEVMRTVGSMNACMPAYQAFIVAPQHARLLAAAGWQVEDMQAFLFEHARNSLARLRTAGEFDERRTLEIAARYGEPNDPATRVPVIATPANLIVAIAGGDSGGFSAIVPSWPASIAIHRIVTGATA